MMQLLFKDCLILAANAIIDEHNTCIVGKGGPLVDVMRLVICCELSETCDDVLNSLHPVSIRVTLL